MYSKALVVLALASMAYSHDVLLGENNTGLSFYNEHFEASPAIWKQTKDLFINVTEDKVISKINITDLRPEKDGEAQIVSGGVGHINVSILLKSPTVFRGYDFLVEVFSLESEVPYVPGDHIGNKTHLRNEHTTKASEHPTTGKPSGTSTFRVVTDPTPSTSGGRTFTTRSPRRPVQPEPKTKEFEEKFDDVTTEREIPVEIHQAQKKLEGLEFEMSE